MSTIIKRIFCNHQYKQINPITLICEKCGKVEIVPCCHEWDPLKEIHYYDSMWLRHTKTMMICKKCGVSKTFTL